MFYVYFKPFLMTFILGIKYNTKTNRFNFDLNTLKLFKQLICLTIYSKNGWFLFDKTLY